MNNKSELALYKALKLSRTAANISFTILLALLLMFGQANPAAVFALIFYNSFYLIVFANLKNKNENNGRKLSSENLQYLELAVLRLVFPVSIVLHFLLGYGFIYKMTISLEQVKSLPMLFAFFILLIRYPGYFIIKSKLEKD